MEQRIKQIIDNKKTLILEKITRIDEIQNRLIKGNLPEEISDEMINKLIKIENGRILALQINNKRYPQIKEKKMLKVIK